MARKIRLAIRFEATYEGDEMIPWAESHVEEEMVLVIPGMDNKFVVLPKVLEGITDRVISEHNSRVSAYLRQKVEEEKARGQLKLFDSLRVNGDGALRAGSGHDDHEVEMTTEEAKELAEEEEQAF